MDLVYDIQENPIYTGNVVSADQKSNIVVLSTEDHVKILSDSSIISFDIKSKEVKLYGPSIITSVESQGLSLLTEKGVLFTYKIAGLKKHSVNKLVATIDPSHLRLFDLRMRYPISSSPAFEASFLDWEDENVIWTGGDKIVKYDVRNLKSPLKFERVCEKTLGLKFVNSLYVLGSKEIFMIDSSIFKQPILGSTLGEVCGCICVGGNAKDNINRLHFFDNNMYWFRDVNLGEKLRAVIGESECLVISEKGIHRLTEWRL